MFAAWDVLATLGTLLLLCFMLHTDIDTDDRIVRPSSFPTVDRLAVVRLVPRKAYVQGGLEEIDGIRLGVAGPFTILCVYSVDGCVCASQQSSCD